MTVKRCPTCQGRGRVPKLRDMLGGAMSYSGPNGENWPHETCPNCYGTGWTGTPDGPMVLTDAPEEG